MCVTCDLPECVGAALVDGPFSPRVGTASPPPLDILPPRTAPSLHWTALDVRPTQVDILKAVESLPVQHVCPEQPLLGQLGLGRESLPEISDLCLAPMKPLCSWARWEGVP